MASNRIPQNYAPLLHLAHDAADGVAQHGAAIGLGQNTAEKIRAEIVALVGDPTAQPPVPGKQAEFNWAVAARTAAAAAERSVTSNARAFVGNAIALLGNFLGRQWNAAWAAAGFTGHSLAVPDDPLPVLHELGAYFTAHAAHENAPLAITAAACTANVDAVSRARAATNTARTVYSAARTARDDALAAIYARMKGLRTELVQLLAADDTRWYAFGFDRPGDGEQPGPVCGLVLTGGGTGTVIADWHPARRADRYHVWRQMVGTDAAPVAADTSPHDPELALTGLPGGANVIVSVAGVNDAGEGPTLASAPFPVP